MRTVEIVYRYDGTNAQARSGPARSEAALLRLQAGNRAFCELLNNVKEGEGSVRHVIDVDARDLGLLSEAAGAPSQHPFAAVLGCSDARVPLELIFNEGPNDLFVVRAAGNGLGSDALGSLRYAAEHLGGSLKLIVVLGHSGCGAVSAAVDVFLICRSPRFTRFVEFWTVCWWSFRRRRASSRSRLEPTSSIGGGIAPH